MCVCVRACLLLPAVDRGDGARPAAAAALGLSATAAGGRGDGEGWGWRGGEGAGEEETVPTAHRHVKNTIIIK